jgi:hypothetical protein
MLPRKGRTEEPKHAKYINRRKQSLAQLKDQRVCRVRVELPRAAPLERLNKLCRSETTAPSFSCTLMWTALFSAFDLPRIHQFFLAQRQTSPE